MKDLVFDILMIIVTVILWLLLFDYDSDWQNFDDERIKK